MTQVTESYLLQMDIMLGKVANQHWPSTLKTSHFSPAFHKHQREATEAERLLATWMVRIALLKRQRTYLVYWPWWEGGAEGVQGRLVFVSVCVS